jgi:hypothetical protein
VDSLEKRVQDKLRAIIMMNFLFIGGSTYFAVAIQRRLLAVNTRPT